MKILPQLELDGQLLIYKQNTKFWGVFLTTKLNWGPSIENVITKARTRQIFPNIARSLGVRTQNRYYIYLYL